LCANMVAGHVLIKIFASFINFLSPSIIFFAVVPIFLNTLLTGFEVMVCVLQAYVFTILTCIYLNNALNLH
jgi:F-type H+-transporting ATPase subunit a